MRGKTAGEWDSGSRGRKGNMWGDGVGRVWEEGGKSWETENPVLVFKKAWCSKRQHCVQDGSINFLYGGNSDKGPSEKKAASKYKFKKQ